MTYLLTKGGDQYKVHISGENGEIIRIVNGNESTSKEVVRAIEAQDRVTALMRKGYKCKKSGPNEPVENKHARR